MNAAAQEHLQAATGDMGADVDALKQLVSMLNKQIGMNRLKHGTLDAAASVLMRTAGARGDKQQLVRMLHNFYTEVLFYRAVASNNQTVEFLIIRFPNTNKKDRPKGGPFYWWR